MDNNYKEQGARKARIGVNLCAEFDGDKPFAVFRHTFYLNKWYYDGYTPFATMAEAEIFRDQWLAEQ